jgi:hypothetical protein
MQPGTDLSAVRISPKAKGWALTRSRRGPTGSARKSAVTTPSDESSSVCLQTAAGPAGAALAACRRKTI